MEIKTKSTRYAISRCWHEIVWEWYEIVWEWYEIVWLGYDYDRFGYAFARGRLKSPASQASQVK